ncbi:hypothetical protein R3P38DRAFT_2564806, partial [Favolaschia claudopus]
RIQSINAQILELQKSIDKLVEDGAPSSPYVDAHNVFVSLMRRLPLYILAEKSTYTAGTRTIEKSVACLPMHLPTKVRNCAMSAMERLILFGRI